jgi:hypothetical protein
VLLVIDDGDFFAFCIDDTKSPIMAALPIEEEII